ncbi:MAG: endonuclease [Saprospiraceae bacterium]
MTRILLFLLLSAATLSAQQSIFPDLSGEELNTALRQQFRPQTVLPYSTARDTLYDKIDRRNDSLYCVYTGYGIKLTPGLDVTEDAFDQGINTEHSYPRGKGAADGNAESDMHHLFPTRENVNSDRGNLPFAEVPDNQTTRWYYLADNTSNTPPTAVRDLYSELRSGVAFEPREEFKGNIARAVFYFYTIYRPEADAADPAFFPAMATDLCNWHQADPADQRELERTWAIAARQSNQPNPFVLDCDLARRAYCSGLAPTVCITALDDEPAAPAAPSVLQLNDDAPGLALPRSAAALPVTTLAAGRLSVTWSDMLGRPLSDTSELNVLPGTWRFNLPRGIITGTYVCTATLRGESGLVRRSWRVVVY